MEFNAATFFFCKELFTELPQETLKSNHVTLLYQIYVCICSSASQYSIVTTTFMLLVTTVTITDIFSVSRFNKNQ
jgi:hypothetical protein